MLRLSGAVSAIMPLFPTTRSLRCSEIIITSRRKNSPGLLNHSSDSRSNSKCMIGDPRLSLCRKRMLSWLLRSHAHESPLLATKTLSWRSLAHAHRLHSWAVTQRPLLYLIPSQWSRAGIYIQVGLLAWQSILSLNVTRRSLTASRTRSVA